MDKRVFRNRIYLSALFFIFIISLIFIKLFSLHFSPRINPGFSSVDFRRGYIKDRNGYVLASSIEADSLYINPQEVEKPAEVTQVLSSILGISKSKIKNILLKDKKFVWVKRKLIKKKVEEIKKFKLKGLHFQKEYKRVYPSNNLASNLLGFVGIDGVGLDGLEYKYNNYLSGEEGGFVYSDEIGFGRDLYLTIDKFIQYIAEQEINRAVQNSQAKQGVVLVMEVKTGRILALAKYPNFNPNFYYNYAPQLHKNFSVVDSFEPGSTLKIIALASALEHKPEILKKTFLCQGKVDLGKVTINCSKKHGFLSPADIIKYSCNAGIVQIIEEIEKEDFYDTLKKFGFGEKTESGLPGETGGILRPLAEWSWLSKYSLSIGHEISVTSLQMAAAYSAIANGGTYRSPAIVEEIKGYDGEVYFKFSPQTGKRIISEKITKILRNYMARVLEEGGTGVRGKSAYYKAAGKTGTSRKFKRDNQGGSYSDQVVSSFIGIAPFEKPEICVLVMVDESAASLSGGTVAAPVFGKVVDRILPQMGIK